ncbi:MAG TPA: deoxyribose-phosphate aldolase, partial [Thermotogota bacterium]|nr:deoxyribose-phosphate aldolase [Thermotogota bacterium]
MNEPIGKLLNKAAQIEQNFVYVENNASEVPVDQIKTTIEHTNLNATATTEDIKRLCEEAKKYQFRSVCIHPSYIPIARDFLTESNVKIVTVIGFPLGMNTTVIKSKETENAIAMGADEVDMVINQGKLKEKSYENVFFDIHKV